MGNVISGILRGHFYDHVKGTEVVIHEETGERCELLCHDRRTGFSVSSRNESHRKYKPKIELHREKCEILRDRRGPDIPRTELHRGSDVARGNVSPRLVWASDVKFAQAGHRRNTRQNSGKSRIPTYTLRILYSSK